MKEEKYDGERIRKVLIGMITDKVVLSRICSWWKDYGMFGNSKYANLVGSWCVEHFKKYGEPPGEAIKTRFQTWAEEESKDEKTTNLIDNFLGGLSDEYERDGHEGNPKFITDMASRLFKFNRLSAVREEIDKGLQENRLEKAEEAISKYFKVDTEMKTGTKLFKDQEAIKEVFASRIQDALFHYDDDLDTFFQNALERGGFLAFAGPQKSGKTHWLVDMAFRAMTQRRRVLFFEIGDMQDWELRELFCIRMAKHPTRAEDDGWPYTLRIPTSISHTVGQKIAEVEFKDKTFAKTLDWKKVWDCSEKHHVEIMRTKKAYFQDFYYPNLSIGMPGIRSHVINCIQQENFHPDVVVIDYADNLAPVDKKDEVRERVNTTWKLMRALAMEFRCLVVTGTQVNAEGLKKRLLDKNNFSEDNRKLSHVTGLIGINVVAEEKEEGITRLNWIVKRKGRSNHRRVVHAAGCFALANPAIKSTFPKYLEE